MTRLAPRLSIAILASALATSCIYGIEPADVPESPPDDTETPRDGEGDTYVDAPDLRDAPPDLDVDPMDAETSDTLDGGDGNDGGLGCSPQLDFPNSDAGMSGDVDTAVDGSVDAGGLSGRPLLLFVPIHKRQTIGVVFRTGERFAVHDISVAEDVVALGPSLHVDADDQREVPYIVDKGGVNELRLTAFDKSGRGITLDPSVQLETEFSRLGVADFDDDCLPDIVYPDGGKIRAVDHDDLMEESTRPITNPDAPPQSVLGAIDRVSATDDSASDGREELYWYVKATGARYIQDGRDAVIDASPQFSKVQVSNGHAGIGGPRRLEIQGIPRPYFPIVNQNDKAGVIQPRLQSPDIVESANSPVPAPVALVQLIRASSYLEYTYLEGEKLAYAGAPPASDSPNAGRLDDRNNDDIKAEKGPGVVPAVSRFFLRVDQISAPSPGTEDAGGTADGM